MDSTTSNDDVLLQWNCPHCQSLLELNQTGDLDLIEPPEMRTGERKGVNGITVLESDPDWKRRDQLFNLGERKSAPQKTPFGFEHTLGSQPDAAIDAANTNDLKNKNII